MVEGSKIRASAEQLYATPSCFFGSTFRSRLQLSASSSTREPDLLFQADRPSTQPMVQPGGEYDQTSALHLPGSHSTDALTSGDVHSQTPPN
jgi:hypothetical protein